VKDDQNARNALLGVETPSAELQKKMEEIDQRNTAGLKGVVDKHGWPGRSSVGDEGAHNAWLLAQHADRDRAFQKRCLKLMKDAVQKGEAAGKELAYLTDRVLVAEGQKQIYGTQFTVKGGALVTKSQCGYSIT
jgi:hypothetical protein